MKAKRCLYKKLSGTPRRSLLRSNPFKNKLKWSNKQKILDNKKLFLFLKFVREKLRWITVLTGQFSLGLSGC